MILAIAVGLVACLVRRFCRIALMGPIFEELVVMSKTFNFLEVLKTIRRAYPWHCHLVIEAILKLFKAGEGCRSSSMPIATAATSRQRGWIGLTG